MKMNSLKISLVNFKFREAIDIKKYQKKPCNRITLRKYDVMRHWITLGEEKRYE